MGITIRDMLFADELLADFAQRAKGNTSAPWIHFVTASELVHAGQTTAAITELHRIVDRGQFESRIYIQAWNCLRALGDVPHENKMRLVYGMVVEVALEQGLDLVAAYSDHTARYFNFSGVGVIWESPEPQIDALIDSTLSVGAQITLLAGTWNKPRPPAPPPGEARINVLTPGGLYFGQGPFETLAKDPLGGPGLQAAFNLMQALIAQEKAKS